MGAATTGDFPAVTGAAITGSAAPAGGDDPAELPGGQREDTWAALADRFIRGHYGTLRGRVRTHVIDAHLREHLPSPPAAIVDVGGGGGNQSIPLARSGYQVTIADPSEAMLAGAAEALEQ